MADEFDFHELNLNELHLEWQRQVRMYRHYAEKLAAARKARDHGKTDRDVAKKEVEAAYARADLAVRQDPEKFGLEKTTEKAIENTVLVSTEYRAAQDEYFRLQRSVNDLEYDVGMAEAAVETLDNRKKALEDAVRLRLADYFAEPRGRAVMHEPIVAPRERKPRTTRREDE